MPLAFRTLSHGTVAFGFFNIETDMLLLEQLFFFADDFCAAVEELAANRTTPSAEAPLAAYRIDRARVGNLHGAIAGQDLSGFIGATYRLYPFPSHPSGFKQNPDGGRTRAEIEGLVRDYGTELVATLRWDARPGTVALEGVLFDGPGFDELLAYVDQGGYPHWRDEVRPAYVADTTRRLEGSPPPWRRRPSRGST